MLWVYCSSLMTILIFSILTGRFSSDVKKGKIKAFMNNIWMWLGCRLRRYSQGQKQSLAWLFPSCDIEEICRKRQLRWGMSVWCVWMILSVSGMIYEMMDHPSRLKDGGYIERQIDHGQEDQVTLMVYGEGFSEKEVKIHIRNQLLFGEARNQLFEEAYQYVVEMVKGENDSLDKVYLPLNLVTYIPGSLMKIVWDRTKAESVMESGQISSEDVDEDGQKETISFDLIYGGETRTYDLNICIIPPPKPVSELILEEIYEDIELQNADDTNNDDIKLPQTSNHIQLEWREQRNNTMIHILMFSIIVFILCILCEGKKMDKCLQIRKNQLIEDYPEVVYKLVLLTTAGMNMKTAMGTMVGDYKKYGVDHHYVYDEMSNALNSMNQGISEIQAYEMFGRNCGELEYTKLAALMVQSIKKGAGGMNDLMRSAAEEALMMRRENMKKKSEIISTKLLLPLGILLAAVMMMLIVPAFLSMNI